MAPVRTFALAVAILIVIATAAARLAAWKQGARLAGERVMCSHLFLSHKPTASAELERRFWAVSDPLSAEYGRHLSLNQVAQIVGLPQREIDAVLAWLQSVELAGKPQVAATRDIIKVCMPARSAEALFSAPLHEFSHRETGERRVRAATGSRISLPSHIAPLVAFVSSADAPLHRFRRERHVAALDEFRLAQAMVPQADDDSTPTIADVYPGDASATFRVIVRCLNGSNNTDAYPAAPCTSNPPAVTGIRVFLVQDNQQAGRYTVSMPFINCTGDGSGSCTITLGALLNYVPTVAQVSVTYSSGTETSRSNNTSPFFLQDFVTPTFLRQLYGIPETLTVKDPRSTIALVEFLNESFSNADLQQWQSFMGLSRNPITDVTGPNNESQPTGEATLDVQVVAGLAVGARISVWSTNGSNPDNGEEPWYEWLLAVSNTPVVPLVMSISFSDNENSLTANYTDRVEGEFLKLGARGVSVLIASGDYGTSSYTHPDDNVTAACERVRPEFPGDSPYITSVGGTQLSNKHLPFCASAQTVRGVPVECSTVRERMCSADIGGVITSGGGFSNRYPTQDYQRAAVNTYLQTAPLPSPGFFNASGRGYPDVAAYSTNFLLIQGGKPVTLSGTSASTPLFASIVALLNDVRFLSGQPPLGFLNPWLYQAAAAHPEAFNDITVGVNNCRVRSQQCCAQGMSAAAGWDPVTGLGSPNFPVLANLALNGLGIKLAYINAPSQVTTIKENEEEPGWVIALLILSISSALIALVLALRITRRTAREDGGGSLLG